MKGLEKRVNGCDGLGEVQYAEESAGRECAVDGGSFGVRGV